MLGYLGLAGMLAFAAPCLAQRLADPGPLPAATAPTSTTPAALRNLEPAPTLPLLEDPLKALGPLPDPARFPPRVKDWMRLRGIGLARDGEIPSAEEMPGYVRKVGGGVLGSMNNADIEAVAMIVLMTAAKNAHEDLKSIMEEMKAAKNKDSRPDDGADELDSLRLQKTVNRLSKLTSTLSNLLKKKNETEREAAQNLK